MDKKVDKKMARRQKKKKAGEKGLYFYAYIFTPYGLPFFFLFFCFLNWLIFFSLTPLWWPERLVGFAWLKLLMHNTLYGIIFSLSFEP